MERLAVLLLFALSILRANARYFYHGTFSCISFAENNVKIQKVDPQLSEDRAFDLGGSIGLESELGEGFYVFPYSCKAANFALDRHFMASSAVVRLYVDDSLLEEDALSHHDIPGNCTTLLRLHFNKECKQYLKDDYDISTESSYRNQWVFRNTTALTKAKEKGLFRIDAYARFENDTVGRNLLNEHCGENFAAANLPDSVWQPIETCNEVKISSPPLLKRAKREVPEAGIAEEDPLIIA
uniref:Uncharacterized protein n=1 Tax=Chromera velia CCMP2878 TaxID=1169474 RepID=A0A0G4GU37_9ALVE|eukprot:Cvel_743.t1-p1 / transcript=Cvel_743.t1 / gene=Cvel_743 / organism=Chromera_velia_CCMP2878 / gene_product=hypothetical protein / transcript_product=hypothetical protein / location=Cvel_scaffold23:39696-40412(-) / protein_length=239 / sequence_SO=supercontig / SO=protein_coding / is_pseudo=false